MTLNLRPPILNLVPENAPFSEAQREWLNGFFAGMLSLDSVTPLSREQGAALIAGASAGTAANIEEDVDTPWHDQTLPIKERMAFADGKPLRWRLMAAMAQQDCGQCGYDCKNYSGAIFSGKEERLNLCVPGGKETARMLKTLHAELGGPAAKSAASDSGDTLESAAPASSAHSRENPVAATFHSRRQLNKNGSEKETWHVEFDIGDCALDFAVGDSFGVFPSNDPKLVDAVIEALDAPPDFPIGGRTLRDVLRDGVSLSPAPDMLFELFSYIVGGERRLKARALAKGEDPDGDAATLDVLAAIEKFPGIRPDPEAFIEALDPLQPRLYSIACSPKAEAGRVALTVDTVRYDVGKRRRCGVASTFLAERISPGDKIKVYVQKANHFALPADPATPIVMIGPGTGVAPFRAFLQERQAVKAPGRNWLFFGHQRSTCDFFYRDEFEALQVCGLLTRLTLAWSRDGDEKVYVQHRMREVGRDLWAWLDEGAHVYVCGDAKRMAKDVELALIDVVAQHGGRDAERAAAFVADLKKQGRYQQDVY